MLSIADLLIPTLLFVYRVILRIHNFCRHAIFFWWHLNFRFQRFQRKRRQAHQRALTDLGVLGSPITNENQKNAWFLSKLPIEIRQQIYDYCYEDIEVIAFETHQIIRERRRQGIGLLNLPLTCRQM